MWVPARSLLHFLRNKRKPSPENPMAAFLLRDYLSLSENFFIKKNPASQKGRVNSSIP